jgi:hypothetical protein
LAGSDELLVESCALVDSLLADWCNTPACELKPKNKKAFISAVGRDLVEQHGKRKYYRPSDVRNSAERCGYPPDIHCWAYYFFSSPEDFRSLHEATGEICDYDAMRAELLTDIASGESFAWSDINLSWLEWPDIDLSSAFDWFDFSP